MIDLVIWFFLLAFVPLLLGSARALFACVAPLAAWRNPPAPDAGLDSWASHSR